MGVEAIGKQADARTNGGLPESQVVNYVGENLAEQKTGELIPDVARRQLHSDCAGNGKAR
jgi:hypothetical protein